MSSWSHAARMLPASRVLAIAIVALALPAALALPGCGGSEPGDQAAPTTSGGGETSPAVEETAPAVASAPTGVKGWIVWVDSGPGESHSRLAVYDMKTGERSNPAPDARPFQPKLFVDWTVWQDQRADEGDIYGCTVDGGRERALDARPGEQSWPVVSDGGVVWRTEANGKNHLMYLSFESDTPKGIGSRQAMPVIPDMSGTTIAYDDWRAKIGQGDIYVMDVVTGKERAVCTDDGDQTGAAIDGDWVVWEDWEAANDGGECDLQALNLKTGKRRAVCTAQGVQTSPDISGQWVAWWDGRVDEGDIYAFDLKTGKELAVCTAAGKQSNPAVSGTWIVWEDARDDPGDIYAYDLTNGKTYTVCTDAGRQDQPTICVR
jgi:beta propeller repeat protein